MKLVQLSVAQFGTVGAVLLALGATVAIVIWPVDVVTTILSRYEASFGFKGGRAVVRSADGTVTERYALVSVDPDGTLGQAGFRAGDVPVAYHGGPEELAWALHRSECGIATPLSVRPAGAADTSLRQLMVPASPRADATGCSR